MSAEQKSDKNAPMSDCCAGDPWKQELRDRLVAKFSTAILREGGGPIGDLCFYVNQDSIVDLCRYLKEQEKFDLFADEAGFDYFLKKKPRFEVSYNLYSISLRRRIFLKIETDGSREVPSIVSVYPGANWFEREIWDMFGIRYSGHPNLKRILMYEEFKGHPLRKDYDARHRQPLVGPKS